MVCGVRNPTFWSDRTFPKANQYPQETGFLSKLSMTIFVATPTETGFLTKMQKLHAALVIWGFRVGLEVGLLG
jgi:hypothetical protein